MDYAATSKHFSVQNYKELPCCCSEKCQGAAEHKNCLCNSGDDVGSLSTGAQSLGVGVTGITTELRLRLCCETVGWLLLLGSISTDIRWLNIAAAVITPSLTGKVGSQDVAVIHGYHVLSSTCAVGFVTCCCAAFALVTNLNLDTCWKLRGWRQWHHWFACRQHCGSCIVPMQQTTASLAVQLCSLLICDNMPLCEEQPLCSVFAHKTASDVRKTAADQHSTSAAARSCQFIYSGLCACMSCLTVRSSDDKNPGKHSHGQCFWRRFDICLGSIQMDCSICLFPSCIDQHNIWHLQTCPCCKANR